MSARASRTRKTLVFAPGKLGIEFAPVVDSGAIKQGCKVHAIDPNSKAKDKLAPGMILVAVNGNDVQQTSFVRILDLLALTKTQTRTLQFTALTAAEIKRVKPVALEEASSNASTDGSFQLHKADDIISLASANMENPLVEAYSAKKVVRATSATTPRGRALAPSNGQQSEQPPQGSCTTPRKRSRPDARAVMDKENATVRAPRTEPKKLHQRGSEPQVQQVAESDSSFVQASNVVCPSCSSYCKHVEYLASEVESLRAALRNMGAKHATMKQEIIHKRGYIKTVEHKLTACQQMLEQSKAKLGLLASEKERALQEQQASHDAQMKEMQERLDMLTRQSDEQQQQIQELVAVQSDNAEAEQLREELAQAQQKLKLRSGQCLLKEGQKQKAGMTYEAQLLEMQSLLETLRQSELTMKHKLRQKDGRLVLLQAQLSKLRQGVDAAAEPAALPTVVEEEVAPASPIVAQELEQAVLADGATQTDESKIQEEDNLEQAQEQAQGQEQEQEQGQDGSVAQQTLADNPEVQILDAEIQVELSRHEDPVALHHDIVERLQNEKDGLHALIQSLKADKDMRERIVETMREELQSIIATHLEMKAELVENKNTIQQLTDEKLQLQARLTVLEVENKLWQETPRSPNRSRQSQPASPEKTTPVRSAPAPFPLVVPQFDGEGEEADNNEDEKREEQQRQGQQQLVEEDSAVELPPDVPRATAPAPTPATLNTSAVEDDDPTPVRVKNCTLRVDPMNQSTQSLLRMVASQSPTAGDTPSTPARSDGLPLSGAHISAISPFPGTETPADLHARVSGLMASGGLNASMASSPSASSSAKRTPLSEPSASTSRGMQPVRTPPRSRSRNSDVDHEDDAINDRPAGSPSKTDTSSVHSLSRFLERTYDSDMMADATLLDSSITLTPRGNSPISVVSQISPSSFSTMAQTPTQTPNQSKGHLAHNASMDASFCEGVFPSPHNMISSRRYLSSQMLYQILKSTPMRTQTIQDPMHATPALLRERASLSQQSPTQRVSGY